MIFIQTDKSTWAVPPAVNMRDPSALNATVSTDPFILRLSTHCFVCKDEANRNVISVSIKPGLIALTVIFFKTTKLQSNVKTIVIIRKNVKKMARHICIFCSFLLLTGTKFWCQFWYIKMPSRFDGASFIT